MKQTLLNERESKILELLDLWKNNPLAWHEQFFGTKLTNKQKEVFLSVRDNPRTAVKSGNTVGKSYISAVIVLWYLITHIPSTVITSAPTWTQVEEILWKEIASLYHRSKKPIGADLLNTKLVFSEKDKHFALGISTNEVHRFQGFHNEYLLTVLDEALGVDPQIWEGIESLHTHRQLAIGNPLSPTGEFFKCFSSSLWNKITISCAECVIWQEDNGRIPGLVTRQWIEERKEDWGVESPLYQARVLGEFPTEGTDILIPMKYVEACRNKEPDSEEDNLRIVSADIATKHGSNQTAILYRYGHTIAEINLYSTIPTTTSTVNIQSKYERKNAHAIVIDEDGVGEGVGDMLAQKRVGYYGFHGGYGQKAMDVHRFKNLRSQFYWLMSKKFEKGLYSLAPLPKHIYEKLKNQLCSIKMKKPDAQGRIQIETKDDMLARSMASPDMADALMMSEYAYFMGREGDIKPYRWHS